MSALLLAILLTAQDEKKDLQSNLCVRGKLLLSDDFGAPLAADWKPAKGKWEVADGALKGAEVADDQHAAVLKRPLLFKDLVLQFAFKFDGATRVTASFDAKGGHVCRVILGPQGFTLQKDGKKDGSEKAAVLGKGAVDLKPGEWHRMLIEIRGREFLAQVDDKVFAFGEHPGIDGEKSSFGFPVSGRSILIDDVKVWEAQPHPDWPAAKEKLPGKS